MEWTYQLDAIETVAEALLEGLTTRTLIFKGDLGAGKTTLIKALVKAMGSDDEVTSPTFSIVNEYESPKGKLFHFDMYRIDDEMEALNFGFEDYLYDDNVWLFIEWPDRVENLLPEAVSEISITIKDNNSRTLKLSQNELLTQKPTMEHCKNNK